VLFLVPLLVFQQRCCVALTLAMLHSIVLVFHQFFVDVINVVDTPSILLVFQQRRCGYINFFYQRGCCFANLLVFQQLCRFYISLC